MFHKIGLQQDLVVRYWVLRFATGGGGDKEGRLGFGVRKKKIRNEND